MKEKEKGVGGEIPSAYQSVYLALHVPSLREGGKGKKAKLEGADNIRMEKKIRLQEGRS